jgi:hypothetical protein
LDHFVTLRIIVQEFCNTKINLLCYFVDFRKTFDTVFRKKIWDRLEEIKVFFELSVVSTRFSENIISKFIKTRRPGEKKLTAILLEECLEEVGCVGPSLTDIVINLLLYANDIILMARTRIPHNLGEKLIILMVFCSNMHMTFNIDKTKVMIIKSNKITYDTLYITTITWRNSLHTNMFESIFTKRSIEIITLIKG